MGGNEVLRASFFDLSEMISLHAYYILTSCLSLRLEQLVIKCSSGAYLSSISVMCC